MYLIIKYLATFQIIFVYNYNAILADLGKGSMKSDRPQIWGLQVQV